MTDAPAQVFAANLLANLVSALEIDHIYLAPGSRSQALAVAAEQLASAAKVKLHVNKAYSKSNANVTDGTSPTDTKLPEDADQAIWVGTTNADGLVSFNLTPADVSSAIQALTVPSAWPVRAA